MSRLVGSWVLLPCVLASACASAPGPPADAWILVQPTVHSQDERVSVRIRHESGAYFHIRWSARPQLVAVPSGA